MALAMDGGEAKTEPNTLQILAPGSTNGPGGNRIGARGPGQSPNPLPALQRFAVVLPLKRPPKSGMRLFPRSPLKSAAEGST